MEPSKKPSVLLSVNSIVRNEETVLGRMLDSIRNIADEIVIVDTGSTDETVNIAISYGAKIAFREWRDNFAAAKNHALDLCSNEWSLYLAADEVFECKDPDALKAFLYTVPKKTNLIYIPYVYSRNEHSLVAIQYNRPVIVRGKVPRYIGWIHEQIHSNIDIANEPRCIYSKCKIEHLAKQDILEKPREDLRILSEEVTQYGYDDAKVYYLGRQYYYDKKYVEAIATLSHFTSLGFVWECEKADAFRMMSLCAKELYDYDSELKYAFNAIATDPLSASCFVNIGNIFYYNKNFAKAIPYFAAAIAVCKEEKDFSYFDVGRDNREYPHNILALCYYNIGNKKMAEKYGKRAIELNPSDKSLRDNMKYYQEDS